MFKPLEKPPRCAWDDCQAPGIVAVWFKPTKRWVCFCDQHATPMRAPVGFPGSDLRFRYESGGDTWKRVLS